MLVVAPCSELAAVVGNEYWMQSNSEAPESKERGVEEPLNCAPALLETMVVPPEHVTLEPLPLTVAPIFTEMFRPAPKVEALDSVIFP